MPRRGAMLMFADGLRASDAALRQMLHQADEERQILNFDPLFIESEDMLTAGGAQQVVRILDPLGDTLERSHFADVVKR